ncbi:MAG: YlxM family DNA-binding protein [Bacillota bacterium]
MDTLEKHLRVNHLFSYYEPLLTDRQREMIHYYYEENYSLHEIAEILGVSRNAVHDQLKRTVEKLEDYEAKLGLLKQAETRSTIIEQLEASTEDAAQLALLEQLKKVE